MTCFFDQQTLHATSKTALEPFLLSKQFAMWLRGKKSKVLWSLLLISHIFASWLLSSIANPNRGLKGPKILFYINLFTWTIELTVHDGHDRLVEQNNLFENTILHKPLYRGAREQGPCHQSVILGVSWCRYLHQWPATLQEKGKESGPVFMSCIDALCFLVILHTALELFL